MVVYHGPRRGALSKAELEGADVVLTTYSSIEADFRRTMMPQKVECRWGAWTAACFLYAFACLRACGGVFLVLFWQLLFRCHGTFSPRPPSVQRNEPKV